MADENTRETRSVAITPRGHLPTLEDLARLDQTRERIMRGRRFQIDSADLLHEARREAGRE